MGVEGAGAGKKKSVARLKEMTRGRTMRRGTDQEKIGKKGKSQKPDPKGLGRFSTRAGFSRKRGGGKRKARPPEVGQKANEEPRKISTPR